MLVNGKKAEFKKGEDLLGLLKRSGYRPELVAVEYNGVILARSDFEKTLLSENDEIEVVSFVGGG